MRFGGWQDRLFFSTFGLRPWGGGWGVDWDLAPEMEPRLLPIALRQSGLHATQLREAA